MREIISASPARKVGSDLISPGCKAEQTGQRIRGQVCGDDKQGDPKQARLICLQLAMTMTKSLGGILKSSC